MDVKTHEKCWCISREVGSNSDWFLYTMLRVNHHHREASMSPDDPSVREDRKLALLRGKYSTLFPPEIKS